MDGRHSWAKFSAGIPSRKSSAAVSRFWSAPKGRPSRPRVVTIAKTHSNFLRMNRDHRSAGKEVQRFDHPLPNFATFLIAPARSR
jgi:hypothetical protein